jgi:hypothetical protein
MYMYMYTSTLLANQSLITWRPAAGFSVMLE